MYKHLFLPIALIFAINNIHARTMEHIEKLSFFGRDDSESIMRMTTKFDHTRMQFDYSEEDGSQQKKESSLNHSVKHEVTTQSYISNSSVSLSNEDSVEYEVTPEADSSESSGSSESSESSDSSDSSDSDKKFKWLKSSDSSESSDSSNSKKKSSEESTELPYYEDSTVPKVTSTAKITTEPGVTKT